MAQRGNVVHSVGRFSVVELVEIRIDDTREVIGYVILGPGADSTWMYGFEEAIAAADQLDDDYRPTPGPKF